MKKNQDKYKERHEKHRVDHQFQVGYQVWLHINKNRMKGERKNIRLIWYGPFNILEKIGTNAFRLDLPTCMKMYSTVNVENLKLYEPPMIIDEDESIQVPTVDDFSPEYLDKLQKDFILEKRIRTSQRGDVEYLRVGIKGVNQEKQSGSRLGRRGSFTLT